MIYSISKIVGKLELSCYVSGNAKWYNLIGGTFDNIQEKLNGHLRFDSEIAPLGNDYKGTSAQLCNSIRTRLSIMASFAIVKGNKMSIKKLWYVHTVEYYAVGKSNEDGFTLR